MKLRRHFYLTSGFVLVGLGIAGAALPLLPTTPFLLLAAFCFARSSRRWHDWLVTHRLFGPYINAFRERRGLTAAQKGRIAVTLSATLLISFLLVSRWYARAGIAAIWAVWMAILYFSRTAAETPVAERGPSDTPPAC
jgi:uncharacterized protein